MRKLESPEVARPSRGLARLRDAVKRWMTLSQEWIWAPVVGRVIVGGLGLALLGMIGRSAFAGTLLLPSPPMADAGSPSTHSPTSDGPTKGASAAVVAPATPVIPTAPPAPTPPASASPPPPPGTEPARGRATPDEPVYINQATLADLHRLPGVGPKRGEAILALRARLGHFRQVEDLLKVKGVGRSSLRKLRPLIRLDPPPGITADAG